jgi:hypothetical protein
MCQPECRLVPRPTGILALSWLSSELASAGRGGGSPGRRDGRPRVGRASVTVRAWGPHPGTVTPIQVGRLPAQRAQLGPTVPASHGGGPAGRVRLEIGDWESATRRRRRGDPDSGATAASEPGPSSGWYW